MATAEQGNMPGTKPPEYSSIAGGAVAAMPPPNLPYPPAPPQSAAYPPYQGSYQNHPEGNYPQAPPEAYKGVPPAGMPSGYPPQQGPYPAPQYGGGYGSTAVPSYTSVTVTQPSVVVVGGCPACRVGALEDDFTCCGVCCAIFFFPLGILCCLAMRQRRCPNCGAVFG